QLSFQHPITRKTVTISAPLPDHMKHSWDTFGWSEDLASDDPFEDLQ
ncbi:MAG: RluA family pseudouridine synthase, partial [Pseudomonadota bacterium]